MQIWDRRGRDLWLRGTQQAGSQFTQKGRRGGSLTMPIRGTLGIPKILAFLPGLVETNDLNEKLRLGLGGKDGVLYRIRQRNTGERWGLLQLRDS